ncbi:MAG: hypothetical protein AMXMBFR84_25490 [Candidatus Hydrogenedentota bacterium]
MDFDLAARKAALDSLLAEDEPGGLPRRAVNLHCHTFFSYNGYGYSPSYLAWWARKEGLAAVGIVDFDVLDAVDEFLEACERVGVRGCAGLETRVFVPEFADREINSPGEPGIAYFQGEGFVSSRVSDTATLESLKNTAQERNRGMVARINEYLSPAAVDFDSDVLPLTPNGNPTERHLCTAYELKAQAVFRDTDKRVAFWADMLKTDQAKIRELSSNPPEFQGLIRAKLMKAGGVGYVKPEGKDFPLLSTVATFIASEGAIPTYAWLNGVTAGEKAMTELLDTMEHAGVFMLNIIPDRNWNLKDAVERAAKVSELHRIVAEAERRGWPLVVGTEMNAHGQRHVDDFHAPEMAPLVEPALRGAHILYGHTCLQKYARIGFVSEWAKAQFRDKATRNAFYEEAGKALQPGTAETQLEGVSAAMDPGHVLEAIQHVP